MKTLKLSVDKNPSEYSKYIDQNGVSWASLEDWFFVEIMGGCGCGNSDTIGKRCIEILELFSKDFDERDFIIYDNMADEVITHWLDREELIEHGGSIGGSWLTDYGEEVWSIIKQIKEMK